MKTKSPEPRPGETHEVPWWERWTDASADMSTGRRILRWVVILAAITAVGIAVWRFTQSSTTESRDRVMDTVYEGLILLPDPPPRTFYGRLPSPFGLSLASYFYYQQVAQFTQRKFMYTALTEREKAREYRDQVATVLGNLADIEDEVTEPDQWIYWFTVGQLHWFSGVNAEDFQEREAEFARARDVFRKLRETHGDHVVLGLHPDPQQPGKSVIDLWLERAESEVAFLASYEGTLEVAPDPGLTATLELANGRKVTMEFFSEIAPLTVKNFLNNIQQGAYDNTAFHQVDRNAGTLTGGSPWSRTVEDRPFIWHRLDAGYLVPDEANPIIPIDRGIVTAPGQAGGAHPFFFTVHTRAPDDVMAQRIVFARITEGMDALEEWLGTEVHDEAGLDNRGLPRTRLGLARATLDGQPAERGVDTWTPPFHIPEPLEPTEAEHNWTKLVEESKPDPEAEDAGEAPKEAGDAENPPKLGTAPEKKEGDEGR